MAKKLMKSKRATMTRAGADFIMAGATGCSPAERAA